MAALPSTTSTSVHDGLHRVVTGVPLGTAVHPFVQVSGAGITPTGTVTVGRFANASCSGTPVATSSPTTLVSGQAHLTGFTFTPLDVGSISFGAAYAPALGSPYGPSASCRALTVGKATPSPSLWFQARYGGTVTSIAAGQVYEVWFRVSGPKGAPTPTGQAHIRQFLDSRCTIEGGGGSSPLGPEGWIRVLSSRPAPTTVYYRGFYDGDARYKPASSGCESLPITKATPRLDAAIHDSSHAVVSSISYGTMVHAWADLTGFVPPFCLDCTEVIPTGQATATWYSDSGCSAVAMTASANLVDGLAHFVTIYSFPPGVHGLRVSYGGDAIYTGRTGSCMPLTVQRAVARASGAAVHDATHLSVTTVVQGATIHYFVRLLGSFGAPTGTAEVQVFADGVCGHGVDSGSVTVTGGTIDAVAFARNLSPGTWSLRALYAGDSIYGPLTTPCRAVTVTASTATPSPTARPTPSVGVATATPPGSAPPAPSAPGASPAASGSAPAASPTPGAGSGGPTAPGATSVASPTASGSLGPGISAQGSATPGSGGTSPAGDVIVPAIIGLIAVAAVVVAFVIGQRRGRRLGAG